MCSPPDTDSSQVDKGALGLTPFRRLVKDPRFVNTIGILETPFPERYPEAIRLLESLSRRK
jgi:deoxyribonuclease IV